MLYTKIRLDFKYGPKDRFYRVVLVKDNPDLLKLSLMFLEILGSELEHLFLIKSGDVEYAPAAFLDDGFSNTEYILNYHLSDLEQKFEFCYDFGESWDFVGKIYKNQVEFNSRKSFIVIDGKGYGILEDNIDLLYQLFDGDIDPNAEFDESNEFFPPWNTDFCCMGDFDLPLDLDMINDDLTKIVTYDYKTFIKDEEEYIKIYGIVIDDGTSTDIIQ